MYGQRNDKNSISNAERIYIGDFLHSFYPYLSMPQVRHQAEAEVIKTQVNTPNNPQFRHIEIVDGRPRWGNQKIDYVKSNLRGDHGAIFYFRCNHCRGRAKYLYFCYIYEPWCRTCCGLKYPQPSRKKRAISRALNKPYLSTETKYMLMKRAGITKEDIANYLSDNCKE